MKTTFAPSALSDLIRDYALDNPIAAFAACVFATALFASWAYRNF